MKIEQFVMAYGVEQDRVRALLPEGYTSLRPVLRINAEIRDGESAWLEFNTPVAREDRRGWLNIAHWQSPELTFRREGEETLLEAPFLRLSWKGVGIAGGCPAEKDNDGCFFPGERPELRPAEHIAEHKEFCDCSFAWRFHEGDASGVSCGKTLPAFLEEKSLSYPRLALTAAGRRRHPLPSGAGGLYRPVRKRERERIKAQMKTPRRIIGAAFFVLCGCGIYRTRSSAAREKTRRRKAIRFSSSAFTSSLFSIISYSMVG